MKCQSKKKMRSSTEANAEVDVGDGAKEYTGIDRTSAALPAFGPWTVVQQNGM